MYLSVLSQDTEYTTHISSLMFFIQILQYQKEPPNLGRTFSFCQEYYKMRVARQTKEVRKETLFKFCFGCRQVKNETPRTSSQLLAVVE